MGPDLKLLAVQFGWSKVGMGSGLVEKADWHEQLLCRILLQARN